MSPRRARITVVPIDLGGSPTACRVRPPLRPAPTPELVGALVEHYAGERSADPGMPLEVAFFHGGLPPEELVQAARPHALRLACSPADLEPERVRALRDQGLSTVEVEVLSFDDDVLRACQRGYSRAWAQAVVRGLRALGLRVGIVLAPGLPGGSHQGTLDDARMAAGLVDARLRADLVRIHPALGLEGSELTELAASGRWRPMDLGQAVTTCLGMVEIFEAAGVPVARIGLQPGADVPVAATVGPWHPNLQALVQVRRFRSRMAAALVGVGPGAEPVLRVHPQDLSYAKGTANENVRALRARLRLRGLVLQADPALPRGTVARG